MRQPPKRSRPALDTHQLSLEDQLAFQRVAELLNKPISALFEANSQHTSVGPESMVSDVYSAEEVVYKRPQSWEVPSTQWQAMDNWQQNVRDGGMGNGAPQSNAFWTQSSGTILGEEDPSGALLTQWTDDMAQVHIFQFGNNGNLDSSKVLDRGSTQTSPNWLHEATADEPWVSVPTDFLNQADFQPGELDDTDVVISADVAGGKQPSYASNVLSQRGSSTHDQGNGQDIGIQRAKTPSNMLPNDIMGDDVVDLDWDNLEMLQVSNASVQSDPAEASNSGWSIIDLTKSHETFLVDNSSQKSVKWVSNESNEKAGSPQRRRGPFQDQQAREATSVTRRLKACVRCRMQKIRCQINTNDPSGVCETCASIRDSKQKIHTLPCLRHKMTEVTLYRTGKAPGLEFTFRWPVMKLKDISDWADTKIRTIQIVSDVCPVPLQLSVRKFVPIPQDTLQKSWMDGKTKKFKLTTPYAIANMSTAVKDMREYINENVFKALEFWLRDRDPLIKETYGFMRRYMLVAPPDEAALIGDSFRIWFAIRRTATTESIVGDDTLDMVPETNDRSYPLFGQVPLPPVMIQQLDMILMLGFLQPLRKTVLDRLQKMMMNNKPKSWMTIYLITFMSLHNAANLTAENYQNARKHGLRRRYAMPTFIAERHHGANVYLSHYHYCTTPCNPFNLDWKKRQTTPFAEMTTNEIDFLLKTSEMVEQRRDKFRRIRENDLYEDDLFFVSQMYEKDWMPRDTVIDYGDETVTGVPLKHFGSPRRDGKA